MASPSILELGGGVRIPTRVVVLGGTGFLGSQIARSFLDAGSQVTVVARQPASASRAMLLRGAEMLLGSVGDEAFLKRALRGSDHVVHAVGCPFPAESNLDPVGDLIQTIPDLLLLLDELGGSPGVGLTFLSSGGTVYGNPSACPVNEMSACDPITPYGITKLTAEKYIGLYAGRLRIPARVLRVANAYGALQTAASGQGLVAAALNAASSGHSITLYGDGVVRDYVDARDVARAVVELAARSDGPRVVNVGSGIGHSVGEVVGIVERVTGAPLRTVLEEPRPFDVREIVLDVSTLRGLMQWEPVDLERGIRDAWSARQQSAQIVSQAVT